MVVQHQHDLHEDLESQHDEGDPNVAITVLYSDLQTRVHSQLVDWNDRLFAHIQLHAVHAQLLGLVHVGELQHMSSHKWDNFDVYSRRVVLSDKPIPSFKQHSHHQRRFTYNTDINTRVIAF